MSYPYIYTNRQLIEFWKSMTTLGVDIAVFNHKFNNVDSSCIFDIQRGNEFRLVFMNNGSLGETLVLPVNASIRWLVNTKEDRDKMKEYFGVVGGSGCFDFKTVNDSFSYNIPSEYALTDESRKIILRYDKIDSKNGDGIYPIGLIDRNEQHRKNPNLPKDKYRQSPENALKTKTLYPPLYNLIKGLGEYGVSVRYSMFPNEKTKNIISAKNIEIISKMSEKLHEFEVE